MSKIGLFYGSSTSHTDYVAYDIQSTIAAQLGADAIAIHNVGNTDLSEMLGYSFLILGIPTWDIGQLQADWDIKWSDLEALDLSGHKVAIFGLGDQYGYPDTFQDAAGFLAETVLALGGELRSIHGALAMCAAVAGEGRTFVLPQGNAEEAGLVRKISILPAVNLLEVCAHLAGQQPLPLQESRINGTAPHYPDLAEVRGQAAAKRALEVAAAGGHSLLMSGPPGAGKSMLAQRFPGLLPEMEDDEALEAAAIHSLAGTFATTQWRQRPFRSPHHSASAPALVGGGSVPRPGEISLAHHGVLFLDELPEFDRRVLEALREPLESGNIHVARAGQRASFPARFQLIAAMNPCPCGHLGEARCRCTPDQVARYRGKLSGPLLDRIDLILDVVPVTEAEVSTRSGGDSTATVRARVSNARERQLARQGKANALLGPDEIERHCAVDAPGEQLLKRAFSQLDLSARGYHRILKVARSIADLAGSTGIGAPHIAEAIQYRRGAANQ